MARAAPATTLFDDPNNKPPAAPFLPTGLVGVGVALVAFEGLTEVVTGLTEVVTGGMGAEVVAGGAVVAGEAVVVGGGAEPSAQSSSLAAINFSAMGIISAAAHPSAIQDWSQEAEASEARGQKQAFSSGVMAEGGLVVAKTVGSQVGDAATIAV